MRHGGDPGEGAGGRADWLDLSTGINPHPWPVPPELGLAGWHRLPTRRDLAGALDAARAAYRVPDGLAIVAAPGTQAIIQWLPRLLQPGSVALASATYRGHEDAWRAAGREVLHWRGEGLPAGAPHAVVVNPNNPDGRVLAIPDLLRIAEQCGERGGTLLVDESYADLDPALSVVPHLVDRPAVVLRSLGKFFGLPGLRLGFAVATPHLAARLEQALGDWAVATPALLTGARALADADWIAETRLRLAREAARLDVVLSGAGLPPAGGTSLFRLVRRSDAVAVHRRLAADGIWVRRFDWADDLLRVGLPPDEEALGRLRAALGTAG